MTKYAWQLLESVSAIVFDCDGTLSTIEGIDYLAENNKVGDVVKMMTAEAMGKTGLTLELYKKRLELVKPSQAQVLALGQTYFQHRVSDALEVINALQAKGKAVYLLSAGLYPAVQHFGHLLKIPAQHIFAVNLTFDAQGNFSAFDQHSPLVTNIGKRILIQQLLQKHAKMAYIGDGLNDLVVQDLVTRFIGYGGTFFRENIASRCKYYINTASLSPLLPLVLTQAECNDLTNQPLYQQGLTVIQQGDLLINSNIIG